MLSAIITQKWHHDHSCTVRCTEYIRWHRIFAYIRRSLHLLHAFLQNTGCMYYSVHRIIRVYSVLSNPKGPYSATMTMMVCAQVLRAQGIMCMTFFARLHQHPPRCPLACAHASHAGQIGCGPLRQHIAILASNSKSARTGRFVQMHPRHSQEDSSRTRGSPMHQDRTSWRSQLPLCPSTLSACKRPVTLEWTSDFLQGDTPACVETY